MMNELNVKIEKALEYAAKYGMIEGDHHREWIIDQMVRALTGCPMVTLRSMDAYGKPYKYENQGMSEAYREFVKKYSDGEDGPETYRWGIGIAP